jgi:hypothetical protein
MRTRYLLAMTLLLPFATMSSVASAGQTHSRWQRTAQPAGQRVANDQAYSAQAYYGPPVADQYATWGPLLCTYQGGPKTNTWACR